MRRHTQFHVITAVSIALIAATLFSATLTYGTNGVDLAIAIACAVVSAGAVIGRGRFPVTAVLVALVAGYVGATTAEGYVPFVIGLLLCLFHAASVSPRIVTLLLTVAVAAVSTVVRTLSESDLTQAQVFQLALQIATGVALVAVAGDATKSRRRYVEATEERARIAEESRDQEAKRRVADERLRLARDLHDVTAHQITVISLQTQVALAAVRSDPKKTEASLLTIQNAARSALDDTQSLLALLRRDDDSTTLTPTRGLRDVPQLLDEFSKVGMRVKLRRTEALPELSAATDVVAYQIIQEALTNAHKHGADGSALLNLAPAEDGLEVTVTNVVTSDPGKAEPSGHGLIGVRERVHAVSGRVDTSVGPGPVFRFTAWVPSMTNGAPA